MTLLVEPWKVLRRLWCIRDCKSTALRAVIGASATQAVANAAIAVEDTIDSLLQVRVRLLGGVIRFRRHDGGVVM